MRKRTQAREEALKILYLTELRKEAVEDLIREHFEDHEFDEEIQEFTKKLVLGTLEKVDEIDALLKKYADNWDLNRMAVVDRNILRFATYELLFLSDVPPKVSINEAINVAKKYSQEKSGKFVNGILDKISHQENKRS